MALKSMTSRAAMMIGAGLLFAASPVAIQHGPDGFTLAPSQAFAKDGGDDRGGDDHGGNSGSGGGGHGSDDRGGDDNGGSRGGNGGSGSSGSGSGGSGSSGSGSGGSGSGGSDDHGSGGHGSDDSGPDDHGRGGHGADDVGFDDHGGSSRGGDDNGVEVVRADGSKEEIHGGRYERQDASGRTVEERPATSADIARLTGPASSGRRTIAVGYVKKVQAVGGNLGDPLLLGLEGGTPERPLRAERPEQQHRGGAPGPAGRRLPARRARQPLSQA